MFGVGLRSPTYKRFVRISYIIFFLIFINFVSLLFPRCFLSVSLLGKELLHRAAQNYLPDGRAKLAISGSAGMGLADSCKVPFVQEVFATRVAANKLAPGTDCIIELGGEDAKILFLTNGTESAHERQLRRRHRRIY